ncbi:FtsQ-type POTRA domain-containing protein [Microbacterium sediminis]|uniref:Cell division protein n=1 Tax=Microbacterium sediminis TaxID=904291 RepID=A0A1B9N989_9MICO|nr:FtsQ-type POTRA domain-containing protein [Microbacterium sediminis]OCG73156.1 cell division protein [Microbacterium sediminis]QBR74505.1 FtsQ-type POTRA domain-containing protein [Microbacterium sediminis]
MKRPGPLPAARPTPPSAVERDLPLRPRDEPDNVIPLERDDAPASVPETVAEPRDRGVGWRELWRASAARRRALRAEIRRFTARTRRRRWYWLGGAAAVVLLIGGSVGAAYSPLFAVEEVRIVGAEALDQAAVQAALAPQVGTPLPLVDHDAVEDALLEFPLIETYTIEARPPHELVIRIVERTPVGVIQTDAGFTVVDAAGVALSTTPEQPEGQPVITVESGPSSPAFAAVGQVLRSLPQSLHDQVSAASAASPQDVHLTLGATGTEVVWGTAEQSAMKALVLEKAMIAQPPSGVSVYDVSSPSAVVFR